MVQAHSDEAAERLLIAGASVRAAAHSALRAGYRPYAVDLFADLDLCECCPATRVAEYPSGLVAAAASLPSAAWFFTGGLENHADLVDEINLERELLGNPGPVLRKVRDPWQVADALRLHGLAAPELVTPRLTAAGHAATQDLSKPHGDASANAREPSVWLRKPLAGAGGCGIRKTETPSVRPARATRSRRFYYQRYIAGTPCSAVYVAAAGRAALLGVTRQLVGTAWCGASGFRYSGSIGPWPVSSAITESFARIGSCLAESFGLRGLFGVDAIVENEIVWPVEVNPRYTASIEVLERALGFHAVGMHVDACRHARLPAADAGPVTTGARRGRATSNPPSYGPAEGREPSADSPSPAGPFAGKAILFAPMDRIVAPLLLESIRELNRAESWPVVADIPAPGERILRGGPVVSVLAAADTIDDVERQLRARVRRVREYLEICPPGS